VSRFDAFSRRALGAIVVAVVFAASGCGFVGAPTKADTVLPQSVPGAAHANVQVSGWWTIEVREPNGSVASHTEFENTLVSGSQGAGLLSRLLARQSSPSYWQINIVIPGETSTEFRTVNVTTPTSGLDADKLVLSASGIPVLSPGFTTGNILAVATELRDVPFGAPASAGSPTFAFPAFTQQTLSAPIPINIGQQVAVTVVISFA
jgi:hypothetical protein